MTISFLDFSNMGTFSSILYVLFVGVILGGIIHVLYGNLKEE